MDSQVIIYLGKGHDDWWIWSNSWWQWFIWSPYLRPLTEGKLVYFFLTAPLHMKALLLTLLKSKKWISILAVNSPISDLPLFLSITLLKNLVISTLRDNTRPCCMLLIIMIHLSEASQKASRQFCRSVCRCGTKHWRWIEGRCWWESAEIVRNPKQRRMLRRGQRQRQWDKSIQLWRRISLRYKILYLSNPMDGAVCIGFSHYKLISPMRSQWFSITLRAGAMCVCFFPSSIVNLIPSKCFGVSWSTVSICTSLLLSISWLLLIEGYWKFSDGKFTTAKTLVPECLNMGDTLTIHHFFQKSWRYMDSYWWVII